MPIRPILRETKIKKYGSPVYEYVFPRGRYTKANIRKALSDLQKQLSGRPGNDNIKSVTSIRAPINKKEKRLLSAKDYKAEVATNLDFGWRTAKWFELNVEPIVNDFYDFEEVDQFSIYFYKNAPKTGGSDEDFNYCLFEAVMRSLNYKYELIKSKKWRYAYQWKRRLGLSRDSKISIDMIPTIEEKTNININVSGDHTYQSPMEFVTTVSVKLTNGHYAIFETREQSLMRGQHFKAKKLLLYESDDAIYDGERMLSMTPAEVERIRMKKTNYCLVQRDGSDCEEQYQRLQAMREELIDVVDIAKSGYNLKKASVRLFYTLAKGVDKLEPMEMVEQEWIRKTMLGSIQFAEPGEYERVYEYDINSMYSFILGHSSFCLPVRAPVYRRLDELKEFPTYGVYRCVVHRSGEEAVDRLFRFSPEDHYTHISIAHARKLGLSVELIRDGGSNAMLYEKGSDRLYAKRLFKDFVDKLYPLKGKSKLYKILLNSLWGGLC